MSDVVAEEKIESSDRNWAKIMLMGALLLLLMWLGIKTWHIGSALYSLWQIQAEARTLLDGGITNIPADDAEQMVFDARRDVLTLKAETAFLMPVTRHLGWIPELGPLLINAPEFMEMADAGTETAAYAVRGLKPALTIMQAEGDGSESRLPQLVAVIEAARPDLAQAAISLNRVAELYENLERTEEFPSRLQPALALADEMLPLAQDGLKLVHVLPHIAGSDSPKTYLILAQNDDELRATGGFITGAGVLTVDNGRIVELNFQNSILIDNINNGLYDYPPTPLQEFMGLDYFVFRDANYWPDFPTSAENAIKLYALGQNVDSARFDGVIAIDQPFMELLLEGTGPLNLPESETTVTHTNIIDTIRKNSWAKPEGELTGEWFRERKDILGTIAGALQQRLETDFSQINPVSLARNMYTAVNDKHLQIYMRNPEVMAVLEEVNWDGRLENPAGQDFLSIVDTNMGYNKANMYLNRSINYEINLANEAPEATLTVQYTHTGNLSDDICSQDIFDDYQTATTYEEIGDQCYFNYLRVYTPASAQLEFATTHVVDTDVMLDGRRLETAAQDTREFPDLTTFATFFVLPRAATLNSIFSYTLPPSIIQTEGSIQSYRLLLNKQAGTNNETAVIHVTLPPDATLLSSSHTPTNIQGQTITFQITLDGDSLLELFYETSPPS